MSWIPLIVSIIGLVTKIIQEYFSSEAIKRQESKEFKEHNARFMFAVNQVLIKNKEEQKKETEGVQDAENQADKFLKGKK